MVASEDTFSGVIIRLGMRLCKRKTKKESQYYKDG